MPSTIPARSAAPARPAVAQEQAQPATDQAPAPTLPPGDDAAEDSDDTDAFAIGPVLGAGLPSVLSVGATLKVARYFGAGVTLGIIPTVRLSYYGDAVLSYQHYDFYGRIYPFGGGFFLGAGAGYVTVEGSLKKTVDISAQAGAYPGVPNSITYDSKGSVRTLVLTPVLGFLHTFGSGFSLGLDAGLQVPIAPSEIDYESELSAGVPQVIADQYLGPMDESVRNTLDKIGRTPLPTVNLRVGWLL